MCSMPFQIVRNDITKIKADIIVNTANPKPRFASGTDSAIYEAAGKNKLLQARMEIGNITVGNVAVTPAFRLDAKYIIHAVGPAWEDGEHGEVESLSSCYEKSLCMAKELQCESIAFPLISTGVYGFPKDKALQIAISVISKFLMENDMKVMLVVFDRKSFELSGKLFTEVNEYIDEHYVQEQSAIEYNMSHLSETRDRYVRRYMEEEEILLPNNCEMSLPLELTEECVSEVCMPESLDDVMSHIGETFQERLLRLIDERNVSDVEVYKKANIDRKLFSKIRCNTDYKPKKKTAVALAIALELNLSETEDLLGRAEIALSPSNKFDLIIRYFIMNQVYDIYTINLALFQHEQPMLGE